MLLATLRRQGSALEDLQALGWAVKGLAKTLLLLLTAKILGITICMSR